MKRDPIERAWNYISPEPMSGCWLWMGVLNGSGYARIRLGAHLIFVHRLFYEFYKKPIPAGLTVDHICRVRCCVNPAHMDVVTHRENCLRGIAPAAKHAKQTHCIHGHEFTAANTWRRRNGGRLCLKCAVERSRRYYHEKKKLGSDANPAL
jgi:hypothetical protein